jgi:putative transposase
MPQSFACLHYHLIFSTKNRDPLLIADDADRLYAYIGGILRENQGSLLAAGGMPDHVHLLVSLGRGASISTVLQRIKGSSSRWIHATTPKLSLSCAVSGEFYPDSKANSGKTPSFS